MRSLVTPAVRIEGGRSEDCQASNKMLEGVRNKMLVSEDALILI